MIKSKKIKKLSGVIFQSGTNPSKKDEDFANSRAQQKSIDPLVAVPYLLKGKEHMVKEVHRVLKGHGKSPLKPLYESLHGKVPYDILRLARLIYRE